MTAQATARISSEAVPIEDALEHVRQLMQHERHFEAVAYLQERQAETPDSRYEVLLAECRVSAYLTEPPKPEREIAWPPKVTDPFAEITGVPEIDARDLNIETLTAGIRSHGALLVRGLIAEDVAGNLANGIRQTIDACQAWRQNRPEFFESPYYVRLNPQRKWGGAKAREWVESAGGVWTADSPRMLTEVINLFRAHGVIDIIADYFGERPMLSVSKSTLRCVSPTIGRADWHQDGAFLGKDIRSVNVWLSLSHCGDDASGLEYVPRRLDDILPTGTHGAIFKWSLGQGLVEEVCADKPTESPLFAPGDALLFDHLFLHRTGIPANISKDRYAIESWFFAPSGYPADTAPLWLG